jgi:hypothetical protein
MYARAIAKSTIKREIAWTRSKAEKERVNRMAERERVILLQVISLQKKAKTFGGIRICRIARIQAIKFLIRAIRKIRIPKVFSCLVPALACLEHWQGRLVRFVIGQPVLKIFSN